jgi:glycosyltransferase involved in cell wall biosynthesis
MRIGMLLDAVFPPDPRVENEALTLIEAGHEVFLFCLHYGNQKENEQIKGIQVRRYLSNKFEYKMSALVYTFPFYKNRMSKKIKNFLKNNSIEAIHIHDIQIASATYKAIQGSKISVVLDLHENRPEIMKFYPHVQKFPGKYLIQPSAWKKQEQIFVEIATYTIVVTEEAKKELLLRSSVDETSVVVLPNTVRESFYNKATNNSEIIEKYKNDFVLLYLGDTGLRRGLLTAIESIVALKKTITNIKLVVVGKSSSDVVLKKNVEELGLEKYVDFVGWQDVSLFPSYINASTICISPLHRNLHHDTTYANKIFQYMSFGKPLLVSDATAQKSIIERAQSGLVHKEKDSIDFTEKVLKLASDEKLRTQMGANGRVFIEKKFSWEQTSKNLVHLYNNLTF